MRKNLVADRIWDQMNDFEKIDDVTRAGKRSINEDRPTYTYLIEFIENIGESYKEEFRLRRASENNSLLMMILLMVMSFVAIVGWIQ
jgi:hypothetical protein